VFEEVTDLIIRSAPKVPIISVLEGGYDQAALEDGLAFHFKSLFREQ
jgi:acetoin utilization deacetylase AcuC-like enzyme